MTTIHNAQYALSLLGDIVTTGRRVRLRLIGRAAISENFGHEFLLKRLERYCAPID
jgi:hypothetical protein